MTRRFVSDGRLSILIIAVILIIDQIIKIAVKTNMCLGSTINITDWFIIEFIENNGMAYGVTLFNKLVLSLLRIALIGVIGFYIYKTVRQSHRRGFIICLSMVIAGASGNMIDSMFYGLIFSASTPFNVSEFVPLGTGYAPFLYGRVVDMFYFPIIVTTLPDWLPFWGGNDFVFFSPVFNFADSCITVGAILIVLFYRRDIENIGNVLGCGKLFAKKIDHTTDTDCGKEEQ